MTYDVHIARAFRYAATALVERPGGDVDRAALASFHRDAAVLLTETGSLATGIRPNRREGVRVAELARHPVRVMLTHLNTIAHPDTPPERPSPSQRWAGRPDSPAVVRGPVQAWHGLVVELLLARHALVEEGRRPGPARAWAVIADVATLAETLATSMADLLPPEKLEHTRLSAARTISTSLAVESREVARLAAVAAGDPTHPIQTPNGPRTTGVVTIPRSTRLPDAVANLAYILTIEQASVPDLLAVTRVLAQTSRATATALAAAAAVSGIPEHLAGTAEALARHATHLATAVTTHQTLLGSLTPGSPLLIAQAREIGAVAAPGLRALDGRPAAAEAASPHLLRYAELIPTVTDTLRRALADLDTRGLVMVRDRSETAEHGWRRTSPDDLRDLTGHLTDAALAARTAPPPIRATPTKPMPAAQVAAGGAFLDLQAALRRRQDTLRPARPAHPMLTATPAHVPHR